MIVSPSSHDGNNSNLFQEHVANTGRSYRTPGRIFVDDLGYGCQGGLQSRPPNRSAAHSLITNNSFAVTRAAVPCYRSDNSLLSRFEFPVIFLGNLAQKRPFSADISAPTGSKHAHKNDIFPVNSLITGNLHAETR